MGNSFGARGFGALAAVIRDGAAPNLKRLWFDLDLIVDSDMDG